MSLKISLPTFVVTFKQKGGFKQITFLFRLCLVFWDGFSNFIVAQNPLFLSPVSYVILPLLNSFLSQDKPEMHLLVINGNYLVIGSGQLDFECIYRGVLFGFLKGKYFPVFELKETSKTSVSMRFVSIVIHIFLKII